MRLSIFPRHVFPMKLLRLEKCNSYVLTIVLYTWNYGRVISVFAVKSFPDSSSLFNSSSIFIQEHLRDYVKKYSEYDQSDNIIGDDDVTRVCKTFQCTKNWKPRFSLLVTQLTSQYNTNLQNFWLNLALVFVFSTYNKPMLDTKLNALLFQFPNPS